MSFKFDYTISMITCLPVWMALSYVLLDRDGWLMAFIKMVTMISLTAIVNYFWIKWCYKRFGYGVGP